MRILTTLIALGTLGLIQTSDPSSSRSSANQDARPQSNISVPDVPRFHINDRKKFEAGVRKGQEEAEKQLQSSRMNLWTMGFNPEMFSEPLDRETGLYFALAPRETIGCQFDDELNGCIEGHNDVIMKYIRDNGLPKYSLKPWESELFDLEKYFTDSTRIDKPIRLTVGGPEATSPGGKYIVRLVNHPETTTPENPKLTTYIKVGTSEIKVGEVVNLVDRVEMIWGPADSWFAVLKYKGLDSDKMDYTAVDLRSVRKIRTEWHPSKRKDDVKLPIRARPDLDPELYRRKD